VGISDELRDDSRFDEDLAVVRNGRDEAALLGSPSVIMRMDV